MFWRALLFFHNVWCWKKSNTRRKQLEQFIFLCYTSLQTFLNFLIMKKQQKRNKIIHKMISSNISKSSIKKSKRNSPNFWIRPGQTSSWWDNFCASQKVSEKWKENFRMSQESFEIMYWTETLHFSLVSI